MRGLLVSLPAAVAFVVGPDLVFEFANRAYRENVGHRELIGLPYREALPELAGQGRFEILERVLRTGQRYESRELEAWVRRHGKEPEQLFIDTVYQPVRDRAGAVEGVLLYGADVTAHVRDRRRLEVLAEQLANTEERYRTLFETLPHGVIHFNADGSILGANPAASEILGRDPGAPTTWPLDRVRRAVHEDGTPYQPEELPAMVAMRTGMVVAGVVVGFRHARTGELRWLRVTAVPDARDEQGRPQRAYAMLDDITEQRRAEASLLEGSKLLDSLRDANVLGMVASTEEGMYDANDAFLDLIGYSRRDLEAGLLSYRMLTPPEWASQDRAAFQRLRDEGGFQAYDKEYIHKLGHRVPVMVGAAVTCRDPLRWVTFVVDLTAHQRAEQEREALRAQALTAVVEANTARERLAFLLRAGDLLAATGSREELLEQVAQVTVPTLADYSVVFLPAGKGTLRAASLAHRDPARATVLAGLRGMQIPRAGPLIVQTAFTDGATVLAPDVSRRMSITASAAPEMAEFIRQVRTESALATPLLVGRRLLGALLLGRDDTRSRFSETDVAVVEEISRRLAAGLANAETFAREHTIAETLQHALLPDAPPEIAGLDVAVHYLPASDGTDVGGDWYDAFPLDGDRVGLAIGDVVGHSIDSASVMGQVRSLLRGYAIDDPSPPDVLRRTNTAVARLLPDVVATVFYAVLDMATGDLAYANAGHPPALLINRAGRADYLDDAPGAMLGASADSTFTAGRRRLPPGGMVLLYTDGLVEDRQRDITEGLRTLALAVQRSPGRTAEQTVQSVQTALLGSAQRADDVCILAVRLAG